MTQDVPRQPARCSSCLVSLSWQVSNADLGYEWGTGERLLLFITSGPWGSLCSSLGAQ